MTVTYQFWVLHWKMWLFSVRRQETSGTNAPLSEKLFIQGMFKDDLTFKAAPIWRLNTIHTVLLDSNASSTLAPVGLSAPLRIALRNQTTETPENLAIPISECPLQVFPNRYEVFASFQHIFPPPQGLTVILIVICTLPWGIPGYEYWDHCDICRIWVPHKMVDKWSLRSFPIWAILWFYARVELCLCSWPFCCKYSNSHERTKSGACRSVAEMFSMSTPWWFQ